jgi:hypothetical protein
MAATSGKMYPVGLRHARVYLLDANGVPDATSTTVYEGFEMTGAKAYELTIPDARRIVHVGDDRVLAQDVLPRQEVSSGTLRVARMDYDVYEALTSTHDATIGEAKVIGYGTSKQGNEPSIAALLYQQAKDAVTGVRRWRAYILPSSQAIINPASLNENAPDFAISLLPSAVQKHVWGVAFTEGVEGFTSAEMLESMTEGIPHIVSWKADGAATDFLFHASRPATATAKIHVITTVAADGTVTDVTSTATKAVDKITIAGPLTSGTKVVAFYEYAA